MKEGLPVGRDVLMFDVHQVAACKCRRDFVGGRTAACEIA
jgi:hypothetical protein